ncbi:MAG: UDP-N-acetylglucosamine--N-acetylmuramyl-(pentapeptide) pyrophosphoryl-undecaprenol N-acetylglucosamine transferase [Leptospirales bacterium]
MPHDWKLSRMTRLAVTGGGTGGHVIPALNLLRSARDDFRAEVLYVGTPGNLEERLAQGKSFPFEGIRTSGFMGKGGARKLKALWQVVPGTVEARKILSRFSPDLLVGTGGYVQIPAVLAARTLGIPTLLLETNVVTGWANKLLEPFASGVVYPYGPGRMTGVPLSMDPRPPVPEEGRFRFPLRILVAGGSQGSFRINRTIPRIVLAMGRYGVPLDQVEVFHQAGEKGKEETELLYRSLGIPARVVGFLPDLASSYERSSLVVARSGAMTVAEITFSGTPAFYVPYPLAVRDHQKRNAETVQTAGGGWVWEDSSLEEIDERASEMAGVLLDPDRLHGAARRAWEASPGRLSRFWLSGVLDPVQDSGPATA